MKKALYKLDFDLAADFKIGTDMSIDLPDGSKITFHKSNGVNHGTIIFETDSLNESTAREYGQQMIEQFLNCMLVTTDDHVIIGQITYPFKPELLNPEEFDGVEKTEYSDRKIVVPLARTLDQQMLDAAAKVFSGIEKLPIEKNTILRALRWFRKASEVLGEDRFVNDWISFESVLGLSKKPRATQRLIPEFLDRALSTGAAERIVKKHATTIEALSKANLVGFRGAKRSEKLRALLERDAPSRAILPRATLCIYEVRNKLFHKGEAMKLVKDSDALLRDIVRECLRSYLEKRHWTKGHSDRSPYTTS